eukprot:ANDGO_07212.mRNA.1 hypothetical protein
MSVLPEHHDTNQSTQALRLRGCSPSSSSHEDAARPGNRVPSPYSSDEEFENLLANLAEQNKSFPQASVGVPEGPPVRFLASAGQPAQELTTEEDQDRNRQLDALFSTLRHDVDMFADLLGIVRVKESYALTHEIEYFTVKIPKFFRILVRREHLKLVTDTMETVETATNGKAVKRVTEQARVTLGGVIDMWQGEILHGFQEYVEASWTRGATPMRFDAWLSQQDDQCFPALLKCSFPFRASVSATTGNATFGGRCSFACHTGASGHTVRELPNGLKEPVECKKCGTRFRVMFDDPHSGSSERVPILFQATEGHAEFPPGVVPTAIRRKLHDDLTPDDRAIVGTCEHPARLRVGEFRCKRFRDYVVPPSRSLVYQGLSRSTTYFLANVICGNNSLNPNIQAFASARYAERKDNGFVQKESDIDIFTTVPAQIREYFEKTLRRPRIVHHLYVGGGPENWGIGCSFRDSLALLHLRPGARDRAPTINADSTGLGVTVASGKRVYAYFLFTPALTRDTNGNTATGRSTALPIAMFLTASHTAESLTFHIEGCLNRTTLNDLTESLKKSKDERIAFWNSCGKDSGTPRPRWVQDAALNFLHVGLHLNGGLGLQSYMMHKLVSSGVIHSLVGWSLVAPIAPHGELLLDICICRAHAHRAVKSALKRLCEIKQIPQDAEQALYSMFQMVRFASTPQAAIDSFEILLLLTRAPSLNDLLKLGSTHIDVLKEGFGIETDHKRMTPFHPRDPLTATFDWTHRMTGIHDRVAVGNGNIREKRSLFAMKNSKTNSR